MTVTLELSAGEAQVLQEIAEAAGVRIEVVLHGLISELSRPGEERQAVEAPAGEPDEAAERHREQAEVEANIKRWHQERQT